MGVATVSKNGLSDMQRGSERKEWAPAQPGPRTAQRVFAVSPIGKGCAVGILSATKINAREEVMLTRRQFMSASAAATLAAPSTLVHAQPRTVEGWPSRSVRVISPGGTGGPGQNFRLYAEHLKETFGQTFVLENMPG